MDCQLKSKRIDLCLKRVMKGINKITINTGLSEKSVAHIIRTLHFTLPFFLLFFISYGPNILVLFSIFFLTIIYSGFIILQGCLLSSIEAFIFKDDFFITDPALELCRMELTTKNRYKISYIVGGLYLILICFIIYLRFYKKGN